jgi:WD40 repeat protein
MSPSHNVYVWDTANPSQDSKSLAVIPHTYNLSKVAWSPDGKTLATMENNAFIHLLKPENPAAVETINLSQYDRIGDGASLSNLMWSSQSDVLMFIRYLSDGYGSKEFIRIADQTMLPDDDPNRNDFTSLYSSFAWTPDNRLISAGWNDVISVGIAFDPAHPAKTDYHFESLRLRKRAIKAILSPHGSRVIGFDQANDAIIWELEPLSLRVRLYGVSDAVWSPDESMLVTYGVDGILRVVDASTGAVLQTFADHYNPGYPRIGVFWSPDSRKIALLDRGVAFIYERF